MPDEYAPDQKFFSELLKEKQAQGRISIPGNAGIPVISAFGDGLAEAYENAMLALYFGGSRIHTQYDPKDDNGNFIHPPSIDCSMRMIVNDPFHDAMFHKCFPGGFDALEEYIQEVVDGIKDFDLADPNDPNDNRWPYTYHQRLFAYRTPDGQTIDQMKIVVEGLAKSPISRRVQAVTWQPWTDATHHEPPCLQSLWFRIDDEDRLNANMRFRSRDGYDAAFMNVVAFSRVIAKVAGQISEKVGRAIKVGRLIDDSDSFHIYGHRIADFEQRFLRAVEKREFEQRYYDRETGEAMLAQERQGIAHKMIEYKKRFIPAQIQREFKAQFAACSPAELPIESILGRTETLMQELQIPEGEWEDVRKSVDALLV